MNKEKICLNCRTETIGKYCHNCKQKSDTRRLNFQDFIMNDIIHGALHLDKGLFFTLKEIVIRPGKVAHNYINGKRVNYYNFFYLSLILLGLILYVRGFEPNLDTYSNYDKDYIASRNFASKYFKYILLSFIPLLSLSSFLSYRKAKLNLAEHSIIACVNLIYFLLYNFLTQILNIVNSKSNFNIIFLVLIILTTIFTYYQTFKDLYPKQNMHNILNAILTIFLFSTFLFIFVGIIVLTFMLKTN